MKSIIRILLAVVLLTAVGFVKIPFILEKAVPAKSASDFVQVSGKEPNRDGRILMTAVSVSDATVFSSILALTSAYSLVPQVDYVVPQDYYDKHSKAAEQESSTLTSSQINALQVAYRAANRPVEVEQKDIFVEAVQADSSFAKELQTGDRIVKIDNQEYANPYEIVDQIEQKKVGQLVTLDYNREGRLHTTSGRLTLDKTTGKPSLGLVFYSRTSIRLDPQISLKSNGVEGSSGGLMFSLEIYNQLASQDITKGRIIAGTGTIDHKGNVGRIAGVEKKVEAADRAGASVFFVPDDTIDTEIVRLNPKLRTNYHEAVRAAIRMKSKMEIVPVKTFDEALRYLQNMP